jgi:hypothetical protein
MTQTQKQQQREAVHQPSLEQSTETVILDLFKAVASKKIPMAEASTKLREHVASMPEEKQEEFKLKAREWGRFIALVGEAFSTELTVIGAGQ